MSQLLKHTRLLSLLTATIASVAPPSRPLLAQAQQVEWNQAKLDALHGARAGLRSEMPNEVAWGAYRAAEFRLFDLVPDLVTKLAAPPMGENQEPYAVRAALLDSAVQLEAAVPAPVLRSYWQHFPVQSAILFARATGPRDDVLLDLLTPATGFRWFAIANLLARSRPKGFAVKVLPPIHLRLSVTVSERGNAGRGGGGGSSGDGVGDGIGINPAGFPPRATYRFESGPWPGCVVLSTGPHNVYYSRTVSYEWQFGVSDASRGGPSDWERLRYVQAYAFPEQEPVDQVRQIGERHENLRWEGGDALRRRVEDLRTEMRQNYRGFLASLVTAGGLTDADAKSLAQPPIDVRIVDLRADKSQPLPAIK
jgi:hypothetical protein